MNGPIAPVHPRPAPARHEIDPKVRQAAEGLESMFMKELLKVMRETVPENSMDLESNATKIYRSMMDSEVADQASRGQGVGLAQQIIDYWDRSGYNVRKSNEAPGGNNHEGE